MTVNPSNCESIIKGIGRNSGQGGNHGAVGETDFVAIYPEWD